MQDIAPSTPKADPSGDYAFELFRKAEAIKPGAQTALEKKALQLTGGANERGAAGGPSGLCLAHHRRPCRHISCLLHRDARSAPNLTG